MDRADELATLLLDNVARPYPYHLSATLFADGDLAPPARLTPIFAGAFDWHSAVHSHWALVRLRRAAPALRPRVDPVLNSRFTADAAAAERAFLERLPGWETPYGLAWLLTLTGELAVAASNDDTAAIPWRAALAELEALAAARLLAWLRRVAAPIRSGEHSQSAFALGLALDWALAVGDAASTAELSELAEAHHGADRDAPWHWEPSGHDFLSPGLGAASLMARVRSPDDFAVWLDRFAPTLGRTLRLEPVVAADRADGKLVHWDGLNLSRAWMLRAIAEALPEGDDRVEPLGTLAAAHGAAGVAALEDMTYAGSHWLPSFAIYWLTGPLM